MRLVHLTDPHLSSLDAHTWWRLRGKRRLGYLSWTRRRRHLHRREVLDRLAGVLAAEAPDLIAVTGDLVQLGLADEITVAREWLDQLAATARVVVVPGNHDLYHADSAGEVLRRWQPYLPASDGDDAPFPFVMRYDGISVVGVNSARPEPFWSAAGELGEVQRARLDAALARTRGSLRCVLVHHPPDGAHCAPRRALRDAAPFAELLDRHGVELVLHGHLHRNLDYTCGARTRVLATASASNVAAGARASYRVLDLEAVAAGFSARVALKTLAATGEGTSVTAEHAWRWSMPAAAA